MLLINKPVVRHAWRAALRAACFACLTLSIVHKSPCAYALDFSPPVRDGSSLSTTTIVEAVYVEDIFDFTVPVGVVSQGVYDAESGLYWGEYAQRDEDLRELLDDILNASNIVSDIADYSVTSSGFPLVHTSSWNFVTFGSSNDDYIVSTYGSPYGSKVWRAVGNSSSNLLGRSSLQSGFFQGPVLDGLDGLFDTAALAPVVSTGFADQYDTLVSGSGASTTFFIDTLTPDIIKSSAPAFWSYVQNPPPLFGYLTGLLDSLPHICDILNGSNILRKLVCLGCSFGYFWILVSWWLRRVFYIGELLTGRAPSPIVTAKSVVDD